MDIVVLLHLMLFIAQWQRDIWNVSSYSLCGGDYTDDYEDDDDDDDHKGDWFTLP